MGYPESWLYVKPQRYFDKLIRAYEEAAEYTGIGRDTIHRVIEWEKLPVLRIGRKSIIRTDTRERFMEINQGVDLLECEPVRGIKTIYNQMFVQTVFCIGSCSLL